MTLVAHDLLAWARHLCLDDELARAEPKRLRYCLLHVAGQLTRSARTTTLRFAQSWPWARDLVTAFARVELLRLRI